MSCNYNLVCEEEYGENSINCRSDCKPVTEAVIYVFLAFGTDMYENRGDKR